MELVYIINNIFGFFKLVLIVRILLSWIPHNQFHPIINFIYKLTEPILSPIRNIINPMGGMDISPMIVFFLLSLVQRYLIQLLLSI